MKEYMKEYMQEGKEKKMENSTKMLITYYT